LTPERFRKLLFLSLAVPTALVILMASIVAFEVGQLRQAMIWVDHTDAVIAETRASLRKIIDAETGLRGYLITGRQEFLEPLRASSGTSAGQFTQLEGMVSDNTAQKERLIENYAAFQNWLNYSKEMIRLRDSQGNYTDFERNLEGKRLMDDIRDGSATIIKVEQELRDSRLKRAAGLDDDFKFSLAGLSLALVTILVLFSRFQLRNLADQYDSALRTAEEKAVTERERKRWFSTLLRSVGDAVIATDAEGRITFMNSAAETATGWSEAEAKKQLLQKVFRIVNAATRESAENPVDKVRRMNAVVGLANHTILIRKDGREINIDDSGAPIRADDGGITGIILIFRDITRQYEMERTLRTTEKLALAGRITAGVAHEIYNPLDAVGNLLHLIQSDADNLHTSEYAELASQELKRVNQVTRSMLSLYRESQSPVPVALSDVLNGALSLLEMQIRNKEAQITCNLAQGATVEGFPAELRQVFTNLLYNALDAIPQRGQILIECTSPETQQDVCVTITDNGSGISKENLPRLFQALFTTKGVNGTGLGLWVSKGIVEKHGGSIEVNSEPAFGASGATFTVILPRRFSDRGVASKVLELAGG
jgi:PAS domain S-box-containing protein